MTTDSIPARATWAAALTAAPAAEVTALGNHLAADHRVAPLSVPQAGLYLLTMRDGVFHDRFNLGEIPVATAAVEVVASDGTRATGGASLLGDSLELAGAVAVCDAVLAHRLAGWQQVADLVARGAAVRAKTARVRGAMLTRTAVDFGGLGDDDDD